MIAYARHSKSAEQLLVFDIGNSSTTVGVWDHHDIRAAATVNSSEFDSIGQIIAEHWQAMSGPKQAVACSVVPDRLEQLKKVLADVNGEKLLVVGQSLPVPLKVKIDKPESVGTDRLCCAAAGYLIEGGACAIADLGTAITVDCVNSEGHFIGGAILPGLALQAGALAEQTALLPRIAVERPPSPLGQDTEQAIRSGIFYGSIGAIKGLVESYASILGHWPVLFLTGSDAPLIEESLEIADKVVPHLCLRGVVLAYQKAPGAHHPES